MHMDGSGLVADSQAKSAGLDGLRVGRHLVVHLHSSNKPDELLQWPCHDDNIINIVTGTIIIINGNRVRQAECLNAGCTTIIWASRLYACASVTKQSNM